MAGTVRNFDWSATPLGPIDSWPQSLKTTVGLIIGSPLPIVMMWGERGTMIYNDAYRVFAGARHPALLGMQVREGWPEVADFNDNVMRVGLAGGTLAYRDQELTLYRGKGAEQVWMDLDYWPIPDESGEPAGVICTVTETTERITAERKAQVERDNQRQMLQQMPGFAAVMSGPNHVYEWVNDAYVAISGRTEFVGRTMRQVFPELDDQGFHELMDQVYATGERMAFRSQEVRFAGSDQVQLIDFIYEPVRDQTGAVSGIFVGGYEVTDIHRGIEAVRESERELHRLADSIPLLVSFVDQDERYVFNNRAYHDWFGTTPEALKGRTVRDLIGDAAYAQTQPQIRRALSGERFSIEQRIPYRDGGARDVNADFIPRLAEDGSVEGYYAILQDIGERKRSEERQAALLALTDALRDLTDPAEIEHASSQILAETLNVSRVGYGVMDTVAETVTIARDYNAPGIASIAGVIHFRDFGNYIEDLTRGETVIFADAANDPRVQDGGAALAGIRATSLINMPLIEQGKVVALLFVNNATPREWSDADVALVREVAARVRTASERARAIVALRQSEASLREFNAELERKVIERTLARGRTWQLSPEFFAVADDRGHFVETNPAWTATFGWSPEEMANTPFIERVHPGDVQPTLAVYASLISGQPLLRFENRFCGKDGEYRWLSWVAVPEEGLMYCSARDVTEEKAAAAERDRLWELSPDLLTVVDYQGNLLRVNPSWTRVLGYDEKTLLSRPYADILHPDEMEAIGELLTTMKASEQPVLLEDRLLAADGTWRSFVWTLSPEPGGEILYGVGRDVTDDKARERQLANAQEALRQSQKMEAVGQLTGGIAHDFNNLLAGISGALELLSKRLSEGRLVGMERYIDAAQGSAQRAASLTQRLLAFSRRQTLDPKPTDVNRLIGGMEDLIRRSVGPDVEVEVVGAGGLWATQIDPSQLENALLNLCINGRDAMAPDGGRLTIETSNKWLDERAAKARDLAPGQYVSLCVTDTGSGMTPEIQAQAFDPFFTTKPLGQGTGLGLSMIHGFVRQSGGQVRIYSEVGKGTTLCLYLPRYQGDVEDGEDVSATPVVEGGHGETVLIIDDEETVRMLVAEVLGEAGYNVIEASDGPSGLDILRSDRRIDLLVSDVGLPGGMNGRQVADAARVTRPDLRVLFITGYAENAAVGNGLLARGMEVLTKPFVMGDLAAKVHDMIEG